MTNKESWFIKCDDCNCETFKIKTTPFGEYGTDHEFICTECEECIGGVINDPMDEWEES